MKTEIAANAKRRLRTIVDTYYDVQDVRTRTDHRIRNYAEHEGFCAIVGEIAAQEARREGPEAYRKKLNAAKKEDPKAFAQAEEEARTRLTGEERHKKVNKLMLDQEAILKRAAMDEIKDHPLWANWLSSVRGIGPCLAGGLIAWIDIEQSKHVSGLWRYSGLGVVVTGWKCHACGNEIEHHPSLTEGGFDVSCPKCENRMASVGHAERRVKGQKMTYNPKLKTLAWKIGESFVKQPADKSGYRRLYEKFRKEVESKPCCKVHKDQRTQKPIECFDAHKFAKAKRLTEKIFFYHVYKVWREELGLPASRPLPFERGHDMAGYIEPIRDGLRD